MAIDKETLIDYARRFRDVLTPKNGFRAAAYGLAILGLAASGTAVTSFPANAQAITLQTDCSKYKPNELGASGLCEIEKNKLAHKEKQVAEQITECLLRIKAFKERNPTGGLPQITLENACSVAARLPRPTSG